MTKKLVTEYFIMLGAVPISWKSKKQNIISKSSVEAEYRAMGNVTSELIWLRSQLKFLKINARPVMFYYKSQ